MRKTTRRAGAVAALAVALAVTAAGCSGSGTDAMSADAPGAASRAEGADSTSLGSPPKSARGGSADAANPGANRVAVRTQAVINTGQATLVAKNLDRTRDDLVSLVQRHGGFVASEQATSDRKGGIRHASLEVRVPAADFGTVLTELRDIATVRHVRTTSQDVTTEVIDVEARVRSMRASLIQLRRLLRQSTDVATLLQIESDITAREAELESTLAQQRYLADQTAMSTLSLDLQRPEHVAAPQPDDEGFLAGLRGGWRALAASGVLVLTVLGAALPFVVLIALVGVPVWLLVRRTVRRPQAVAAGSAPPPPSDTPREP